MQYIKEKRRNLIGHRSWFVSACLIGMLGMQVSVAAKTTQNNNQQVGQQYQNIGVVRQTVENYLTQQIVGMPGKTTIEVGAIDPNLRLANCQNLKAFMPTGSRPWGKTSVGVKCNGKAKWTIYVQSQVHVFGQYLESSAPLHQGKVVDETDLTVAVGDLTKMPPGVFTAPDEVIGRIVRMSIPAGTVLRDNLLKLSPVIQRGQTVVITSAGKGFKVAAEGKALGNAAAGQVVQVKVSSGQVIAGVAKAGGQIEVKF